MSGPFLRTKPKFGRLHAMLGISPQLARGLLEYLWDCVFDTGDPVIGDAAAVETAAGWDGEPGKFCAALLACGGGKAGFIEEIPGQPGMYQLHDLLEHTPADRVRKWVRQQERREKGQTISQVRAAAAHARWAKANAKTCKPMQMDAACMPLQTCNGATESAVCASALPPDRPPELPASAIPSQNGQSSIAAKSAPPPAAIAPPATSQPPPTTPPPPARQRPPAPPKPSVQEVAAYFEEMGLTGDVNEFIAQYQPSPEDNEFPFSTMRWQVDAFRWFCETRTRSGNSSPLANAMLELAGQASVRPR